MLLMPAEMLMDYALANPVSPTIPESVPAALRVLSGAHQPTSVSSSVDKIQLTLPQPTHVPATLVSVSSPDPARPVPMDTSSPTDTA